MEKYSRSYKIDYSPLPSLNLLFGIRVVGFSPAAHRVPPKPDVKRQLMDIALKIIL